VADPALAERIEHALDQPWLRLVWPAPDGDIEADVAVVDRPTAIRGVPTVLLSSVKNSQAADRA
jgi:hypothetical protein